MKIRALAAAAILALGATYVSAGTTSVNFASDTSLKHLGAFGGTATYDSGAGELTLVVQNTTPTAAGGYLTAFAFDLAGSSAAQYEDPDGIHQGFDDIRNQKGMVNAAPFGKYEAGAGLDGRWLSGGNRRGIAAGAGKAFVFDVTGTGASSLTANDFFSGGKSGLNIVASFKGLKHGRIDRAGGVAVNASVTPGSDILNSATDTASQTDGNDSQGPVLPSAMNDMCDGMFGPGGNNAGTTAVPVPAAAWTGLTTFALIGLGAARRRSRTA